MLHYQNNRNGNCCLSGYSIGFSDYYFVHFHYLSKMVLIHFDFRSFRFIYLIMVIILIGKDAVSLLLR